MKMLKKIKTDMWINVFMMLLIGILFIVRPQDSLEVTAIIAGAVIFANGIFAGLGRLLFKRISV